MYRPRMEKSHSACSRTVWCVVNMFHKNGTSSLTRTNGPIFYSILCGNLRELYLRLKYMYSVISVLVDSLPGNTKNRGIDPFVAFGVRFSHSWADTVCVTHVLHCVLMQCIVVLQRMYCSTRGIRSNTAAHVIHCNTAAHVIYCNIYVAILQYNATHCNTLQHTHTHNTHTHMEYTAKLQYM